MKIEQLGEFGLIERIRAALPGPGPNVIMGIGDDVAVLRTSVAEAVSDVETVWLATCDVQVEGAHFLRDAIPPRSLGRKSLAINLSDIASAGGTPRYALLSLGLPAGLDVGFVDTQANVLRKYFDQYFPKAIQIAAALRQSGAGRYVWTTGSWLVYGKANRIYGRPRSACRIWRT